MKERLQVLILGTYKAGISLFNFISIKAVLILNGNNSTSSIQICKFHENRNKLLPFGTARALVMWYLLREKSGFLFNDCLTC